MKKILTTMIAAMITVVAIAQTPDDGTLKFLGIPVDGAKLEMIQQLQHFRRHATLIFALASMNNLARNGRVPMAVAKAVGILNIRIIAVGDENGRIKPVDKCRGDGKLPKILLREMEARKYAGGHVHIDHCLNPELAERIRALIQETFPGADVTIGECRGLCSYYAEQGGVIIEFDDEPLQSNAE